MNSPARTLRVEHHLDLDTLAKILVSCELPPQPRRQDVRRAARAALIAHDRLGALHRYDLQHRDATTPSAAHQHQQRLAACRRLAEVAFPARPTRRKGRPLMEVLYVPDTP